MAKRAILKKMDDLPGAVPYNRIANAATTGGVVKTDIIGQLGGSPFEHVWESGGLLVGFDVSTQGYYDHTVIASVQPIYITPKGEEAGPAFGHVQGDTLVRIRARPNYVVGAITGKGGNRVDGFKVHFVRLKGGALETADTYESEWIGGPGGGPPKALSGEGKMVVGIFGRTGDGFDCLGLIRMK